MKCDTEERSNLLQEVERMKKEEQEIKKQIAKFSNIDPDAIAEMKEKAKVNEMFTDRDKAVGTKTNLTHNDKTLLEVQRCGQHVDG